MRWITKAPVYVVDKNDFESLCRTLKENIKYWKYGVVSTGKGKNKPNPDVKKWNADVVRRADMADEMWGHEGIRAVYKLTEGPVAAMVMKSQDRDIRVEYLVSHIGAKNGGDILLEWAVNYSQDNGKNGILTLFDATGTDYYKNLGFDPVSDDPGEKEMRLDPRAKSDKWVQVAEGEWKLTAFAAKQYLESA